MTSITPEYSLILKHMHESRPPDKKWGSTGARNAGDQIASILRGRSRIRSVLDYGAGQGSLGVACKYWDGEWVDYDPGIPGIDKLPERSFDMIVSSDVLEHVEPECIDDVIVWMKAHATQCMYHHIACDPCGLTLPDGRNAHLITERLEWWRAKFETPGWTIMEAGDILVRKRGSLRRHCTLFLDRS